ncbi:dicarboxylate transporter/tellurite-resistance protein TehA [Leptolyngbya sp. FACHB-36]|uniref:dicarboxylate transporter/tellurite-resistance protein TehA n=1 Tax=Leptolyngbya sp. FACHB-36 TaxID=2692808 RepID=UPI001680E4BE|nr:dicarboxylate transporter/tellurite-resistance protein TehA [Leptolyngbya sp. FACHB-36]MBD2020626.1 dicarboxylate transporter/tellurite-resistance protein TehA [Leptolyngbya sp. FACHB-36]
MPASFFSMVLGLVGLGSCWRVAGKIWQLPVWVGESIMLLAAAVWFMLLLLYISKWLWAREGALVEFKHPILCCFIGLVPVSTLLVALAIAPYSHASAVALFVVGAIGQLSFGVYRSGQFWMGGRKPEATTPVLYLTGVAGSFVSTIIVSSLGYREWGVLFFGMGMFLWLGLESIIMQRLYLLEALPKPLRPTLGLQLAPPAVGCVAYLSITSGPPDIFAQMLLGYGLLQALILLRLMPWLFQQPFTASYWAFTLGIAALTLASLHFVERSMTGMMESLAVLLFIGANIAIGSIALGTVRLLLRGKLLQAAISAKAD